MIYELNLAHPEHSDIEFKISQFPDGQQSIIITHVPEEADFDDEVHILSRMNSFRDVEVIICAARALRGLGVKDISLYIPYCIGGRSDRKFEEGSINYIKEVIAPIINLQNFSKVTVMDPHSDVLEACINNFAKESNFELVDFALKHLGGNPDTYTLVSPDAGAMKKVYAVSEHTKIRDIIVASKVRDTSTGKIVYTDVPVSPIHAQKEFIIVDDICDGGRTFVEIAKNIHEKFTDAKVYLIVTHGIFSAGDYELAKHFTGIYTTDSIHPNWFGETTESGFYVKTLKVF
jgi:ribose-phosphate pyrophosphokinase